MPFVAGCFGVLPSPVPPPAERADTDVRGVVLAGENGEPGEEVHFSEVYQANWTENALFIAGSLSEGEGLPPVDATREYDYEELSSVLIRQLDAGKTSLIVGGLIVGTIAVISLLVTGQTRDNTILDANPGW